MSLKRRIFTKDFKQQVLREVQAGKSIAQAAREHALHPNLIGKWQTLHAQYAQSAFQGNGHAYTQDAKIADLYPGRQDRRLVPRTPRSPNSNG